MITITLKFPHHPELDCIEGVTDTTQFSEDGSAIDAVSFAAQINLKERKIYNHPTSPALLECFKQHATLTGQHSLTVTFS